MKQIKWTIVDEERAESLGIRVVPIDTDQVYLWIDIKFIPQGYTIEKFINEAVEKGIIVSDSTWKNHSSH